MPRPEPRSPIAVVGLGALFPGSTDATGFWRDVAAGTDRIGDVPATHWLVDDYYDPDPKAPDKTYARRGAFLSPVAFDPLEHGVPPSIVPATDTSQLLSLILAKRVLEDATRGFSTVDRDRISVILGLTSAQELLVSSASRLQRPVWVKALREHGLPESQVQAICDRIAGSYTPWQESTFPGLLGNVVAGRIANRLNLGGTNCVTDAACASTFSALSMAISELRLGESDMVLTGGVETFNDIFMFMCFSKTPALSPTGDCRPFDAHADGTMLGEGLGFVALRRLADAERDGDRIYAVIRGVGSSSDGRAKSVYAPVPEGQAKALRRAYAAAGYGPDTVELIEAHGTGTKAGDVAEFEGLRQVFDETGRPDRQWCALGSVKSQIGHTKAAAGAAGLIKAVLSLHHRVLPPTIKVERPHPALSVESSPFYVNTQARPWVRDATHPRRASVSSFGFGGSNFHVVVEEYRGPAPRAPRLRTFPTELVALSAPDPAALAQACRRLAAELEGVELADVARRSHEAFSATQPARAGIVAGGLEELEQKLERLAVHVERSPDTALGSPDGLHYAHGERPGRAALLFPGQGSQYLGMGADLAMAFEEALTAWDEAAGLRLGDVALHEVVFPRPVFSAEEREERERRLTATEWAQPALGVASRACLAVLSRLGVAFDAVAGHSFGEVTALHAAGVVDAAGLLRIARRRGELMASASSAEPGAMLAVTADLASLGDLLGEWGDALVVANHNSPRQVVLSGRATAIEEIEARLRDRGVPARRLPVSTAFHSPLVAGAAPQFRTFLTDVAFRPGRVPVYSNASAAPYPADADAMRDRLAEQIACPVRFAEQIEALYATGVRTFLEVGPGSVLTRLVDECLDGRTHVAVSLDRKGRHGVTSLWHALSRLAVAGVPLCLERLWDEYAPPAARRAPTPHALAISGANYAKPYPPPGGTAMLPAPNPETAAPVPVAPRLPAGAAGPTATTAVPWSGPAANVVPEPNTNDAWLDAYLEMQRQTAEAHAAFQRAMAESHQAFLQAAEASFAALAAVSGGPMAGADTARLGAPRTDDGAREAVLETLPSGALVPPGAPPPQPTGSGTEPAFERLLLDVVAEKTGYPAEMLRLDMELEADLGIDSIKRVEILSTLQEQLPALASMAPSDLAALRTLGEIVERVAASHAPGSAPPVAARSARPAGVAAEARAEQPLGARTGATEADFAPLLLGVVAEKTGYPAEMLRLDMELEADLGIDSIKRVEILSTLQEQLPALASLAPSDLAALRTLAQIVERVAASHASTAPGAASLPSPAAAAPETRAAQPLVARTGATEADFAPLLLGVVAEKTGYPAEMLRLDMELEADLGIDSIKRVEILSGLQERVPDLAALAPSDLAALRTLAQIVEHVARSGAPLVAASGLAGAGAEAPEPVSGHEPGPGAGSPPSPLGRFAPRLVPTPPAGLAMTGLFSSGPVWITPDGTGIAAALAEALVGCGLPARVSDQVPADARAVVFLGGLREVASADAAIAINAEAFRTARTVAAGLGRDGGVFVTVQDTGGDFGLSGAGIRAWLGGLTGLVKSAAHEWPQAAVKAIDVERGDRDARAVARAVCDELLEGGIELEVGLRRDGIRVALSTSPVEPPVGEPRLEADAVVVATGGARGVTAACLEALARTRRLRIAILGRTALPEADEPAACREASTETELTRALAAAARQEGHEPLPAELRAAVRRVLAGREARARLDALRAAGAEVLYLPVDVRDAASVAEALRTVRRQWGPVSGLIHAAGVLADRWIAEKTDEQFAEVVDTKVRGLQALLAATEHDPLEVIGLFSSISARAGNAGQADYAIANEILNKVAAEEARRRGAACLVRAWNWGPWGGGMVDAALRRRFEDRGVRVIEVDDGAATFVAELRGEAAGPVEVVLGPPPLPDALTARPARAEAQLDVRVDAVSHPYLASHRLRDTPVVPVVMVLEWFARAASAYRRDLVFHACRDLRVLRGIALERFAEGRAFRIACREVSNGSGARLALELRGTDGTLHYSAAVEMVEAARAVSRQAATGRGRRTPTVPPWSLEEVYGGLLFHGPDFHVIRSLEEVGDDAGAATLAGVRELGWAGGPWRTDAAALDGGLQLAILWGHHALGKPTLPTRLGAFLSYTGGPTDGPIRCTLTGRRVGDHRTISDLAFVAPDGRLLAELRDVEMHAVPEGEPATLESLTGPAAH